jgi:hypothetical protein
LEHAVGILAPLEFGDAGVGDLPERHYNAAPPRGTGRTTRPVRPNIPPTTARTRPSPGWSPFDRCKATSLSVVTGGDKAGVGQRAV